MNVVKSIRDIGKDFRKIPNLCIPMTVVENRNLNIDLDKLVSPRSTDSRIYLFERGKENKYIEPYSIKNYFSRILLNYDESKIKFLTNL